MLTVGMRVNNGACGGLQLGKHTGWGMAGAIVCGQLPGGNEGGLADGRRGIYGRQAVGVHLEAPAHGYGADGQAGGAQVGVAVEHPVQPEVNG